MSIATDKARIEGAKAAIAAAIADKGVTVPDGTKIDGMAKLIAAIEAGGGSQNFATGTFTLASDAVAYDGYTITHNLGMAPTMAVLFATNRTAKSSDEYGLTMCFGSDIDYGGTARTVLSGVCSRDNISAIASNGSSYNGALVPTGTLARTSKRPVDNNTFSVWGATANTINFAHTHNTGALRSGWTYRWVVFAE